jgi:hypothetical protein
MRLINPQSFSWRPIVLNVLATLAYFVLVMLFERIWSSYIPFEQPLIIMLSTLVPAAALLPLLILVWRRSTPGWREVQQRTASPLASAGALLISVVAAIPIYVISVVLLRWATNSLAHAGSAQSSITLATLVALVCGTALFLRLRRAVQTRETLRH